jgi:hypothetical protein
MISLDHWRAANATLLPPSPRLRRAKGDEPLLDALPS